MRTLCCCNLLPSFTITLSPSCSNLCAETSCHHLTLAHSHADPLYPFHAYAVCCHKLAPHDSLGVPPCVHASVLEGWRGGPCCARCGCHCPEAGIQRGLHCGAFFWHLCGIKIVSAAPCFGAITGEQLHDKHVQCPSFGPAPELRSLCALYSDLICL